MIMLHPIHLSLLSIGIIEVDVFSISLFECGESPWQTYPESKVHGTNMGPIWGRQDPGGPHVGPIKFAIWVVS